jgi:hypothetical protein
MSLVATYCQGYSIFLQQKCPEEQGKIQYEVTVCIKAKSPAYVGDFA